MTDLDLHAIRAHSAANPLEAVDPKFVRAGLLRARERTMAVLRDIHAAMHLGMHEDDARTRAIAICAEHGATKHWHQPHIRFGRGTTLTSKDPERFVLADGDPISIDLGPVWPDPELGLDYEGDYGDTFVAGTRPNPKAAACADVARQLFRAARDAWHANRLLGKDIYAFLRQRSQQMGYVLVDKIDGHRVADFPHHKYCRQFMSTLEFSPAESLWIIEVQIHDPDKHYGAFFEDILM